jgi:hypothetical protein
VGVGRYAVKLIAYRLGHIDYVPTEPSIYWQGREAPIQPSVDFVRTLFAYQDRSITNMLIEQGFDFRKAIYEVETCVDRSEFVSSLMHFTYNSHQTVARPVIPKIVVVYRIDFAIIGHLQYSFG